LLSHENNYVKHLNIGDKVTKNFVTPISSIKFERSNYFGSNKIIFTCICI